MDGVTALGETTVAQQWEQAINAEGLSVLPMYADWLEETGGEFLREFRWFAAHDKEPTEEDLHVLCWSWWDVDMCSAWCEPECLIPLPQPRDLIINSDSPHPEHWFGYHANRFAAYQAAARAPQKPTPIRRSPRHDPHPLRPGRRRADRRGHHRASKHRGQLGSKELTNEQVQ